MKRRSLLGFGAIGLLGAWALRPSDQGQPHASYFAALNQLLRREGGGIPLLVIDLDRLDQNADLLAQRLGQKLPVRLVTKSLASTGLLNYLTNRLGTQRFMVFHQPQLNQLAQDFPQADLLLGKPLPAAAALAFYQQLPVASTFIPARGAQLSVNGQAAPGKVFPQERGGRPSSSCVLAWSETWTKPRG